MERKYEFSWGLLGDITIGRPNLGPYTRIEMYRLMQFTLRDVLEQEYGSDKADELFYKAGRVSGTAFYNQFVKGVTDLSDLVKRLQDTMKEMGIGIFRMEKADENGENLEVTISEDLDCSGLPELSYEICTYDEGFIAAILEKFAGKAFNVKEIECWCTGARTCRFRAEQEK